MVADALRLRILSGQVAEGSSLPRQEDLLDEFGVSLPSIREALRILETEGLITVLRGKIGGAIVHPPQAANVAYMLGMVLQSRSVPLTDVLGALQRFEPLCAAACAVRGDRESAVLPQLRATLDAARKAIGDAASYTMLARQFHADLVAGSGNETMILVVGALESLWSAHVEAFGHQRSMLGTLSDFDVRAATAADHERLYRYIARGNPQGAERIARQHLSEPGRYEKEPRYGFDLGAVIDASVLRNG
jgi:DNA-binding FadR family transcriptional regulator